MRLMTLATAGLLAATLTAAAQPMAPGTAAQPNAADGPSADMPPPPPGGPRGPKGDRGPPPPRGAALRIDRGPDGAIHLDVRCAERDSTKDCADIAAQLLDKLNSTVKGK